MKVLIFIVLSLTALAKAEKDLSRLKPIHIYVNPKTLLPPQPRIVGGKQALSRQFPHQVALFINKNAFCGGSLIKPNIVLTAAHCVDFISSPKSIDIYAGINNIKQMESTAQLRKAKATDIKAHEKWDPYNVTKGNDIAFIRLQQAFNLTDYVQTVALYNAKSTLTDVQATVSGWGRFSDTQEKLSDKLQYVTSKIISIQDCAEHTGHFVPELIVCLSGKGNIGACTGDSGGPLHISENNKLYQVGIVSFGAKEGCQKGYPSAFTRVSEYSKWLNETLPK